MATGLDSFSKMARFERVLFSFENRIRGGKYTNKFLLIFGVSVVVVGGVVDVVVVVAFSRFSLDRPLPLGVRVGGIHWLPEKAMKFNNVIWIAAKPVVDFHERSLSIQEVQLIRRKH